MRLLWDERAWSEYLDWQSEDRKALRKINDLLKDIMTPNRHRSLFRARGAFSIL